MKFNSGFDFDVLLGTDILPKMNIGLTGAAFRFSSEHSHSDTATDEIQILENINIDQVSCLVINDVFIYYFIIHLSPAYVRLYN
jgi:hypothetical protein